MNIVFTGGGTGGHFYPIIAVADSLQKHLTTQKESMNMYYMAPEPYNQDELDSLTMRYIHIPAGKRRRYFSLFNIIDVFKTLYGICYALVRLFLLYPDVVFAKGAYGSFPVLVASRILFIPVIIHESDSVPGRVNKWAGTFARRIAVSYAEAARFFPQERTAYTGQPIRTSIIAPDIEGGKQTFATSTETSTILILGGSQGAQIINNTILEYIADIVKTYTVIHQAGDKNVEQIQEMSNVFLSDSSYKNRYYVYGHMDTATLRKAVGVADIIISRAGSTLFEIAVWGIPSIIIPLESSNGDHQRKNAYAYAQTGSASVIEENNLKPHILYSEINRILNDTELYTAMKQSTKKFAQQDASKTIAHEIYHLTQTH